MVGGVVNSQDYGGVSTRFAETDRNVHVDISDQNRLRPTNLSVAGPQVFGGRPSLDCFSPLYQDKSYPGLPPLVKARSIPYTDKQEAFFSGQKLTNLMSWAQDMVILGRGSPLQFKTRSLCWLQLAWVTHRLPQPHKMQTHQGHASKTCW